MPIAEDMPIITHRHKLHLSEHHRGGGWLTHVASLVNKVVGAPLALFLITLGIVAWLFAGNVIGFDKTPWPLLLTVMNLPQLSIMVSLQVSANLSQKVADARAQSDHETLQHLVDTLATSVPPTDG